MAEQWPASLQDCLNDVSWSESPVDTAIRNQPSTGPAKSRRRYTNPERGITGTIWLLSDADWNTFRDFYDVTLQGGILEFEFEHPITQVVMVYVFNSPYTVSNQFSGTVYPVRMEWRQQP